MAENAATQFGRGLDVPLGEGAPPGNAAKNWRTQTPPVGYSTLHDEQIAWEQGVIQKEEERLQARGLVMHPPLRSRARFPHQLPDDHPAGRYGKERTPPRPNPASSTPASERRRLFQHRPPTALENPRHLRELSRARYYHGLPVRAHDRPARRDPHREREVAREADRRRQMDHAVKNQTLYAEGDLPDYLPGSSRNRRPLPLSMGSLSENPSSTARASAEATRTVVAQENAEAPSFFVPGFREVRDLPELLRQRGIRPRPGSELAKYLGGETVWTPELAAQLSQGAQPPTEAEIGQAVVDRLSTAQQAIEVVRVRADEIPEVSVLAPRCGA